MLLSYIYSTALRRHRPLCHSAFIILGILLILGVLKSHVGTFFPLFFPENGFISTECCVHCSALATSLFWKKRAQRCSVKWTLPSNFKPLKNSLQSKLFTFSLNGKPFCPVYSKMRCRENKKWKPGSKAEKKYKNAHWNIILHKRPKAVDYFSERSLILNPMSFLFIWLL